MTPEEKLKKGLTALRLEVDSKIVDELEKLVRQAKSEWCKKQRENCANNVNYITAPFGTKELISNAPEP